MGEKLKSSSVSELTIPPRIPFESFFGNGNLPSFSPGPMTLVSSYFSDPSCPESEYPSFSQLLAGAMASPLAKPPTLLPENSSEEKNTDKGYQKNRPMSLMVAQSPLFTIPTIFSPSGLLNSPGFFSPLQSPFGMSHQQALAHVTAQAALSPSYFQNQPEYRSAMQGTSARELGHDEKATEQKESSFQPQLDTTPSDQQVMKSELPLVSQSEDKPSFNSIDRPASDGYNWRKYGQKMVKTSDCPRSYYKCTHLKCPVKKKVERSIDGHITEITYKGHHNHELPGPTKRRRDSCAQDGSDCSKSKPEIKKHCGTAVNSLSGALPAHSEHVSTEMASEPPVSNECVEIEDTATATATETGEGHDDEPILKRMKTTVEMPIPASSHKTSSDSKIVVQTRSEVDILDDGFKWRKYGQKVVKGNHHPRSYYRCTYPGCNVRKHVERASADPTSVVTTYEGKHSHDIPIARNRSHSTTQDTAHPLNEQEVATWRPSLHEIPVCRQLKDEQIAA